MLSAETHTFVGIRIGLVLILNVWMGVTDIKLDVMAEISKGMKIHHPDSGETATYPWVGFVDDIKNIVVHTKDINISVKLQISLY